MRFLLVAVFTAALIGNGLTALSSNDATPDLTARNVLLAEVMDQNDDGPTGQILLLNVFTRPDNPSGNVNPAAPRQDTRQTNRHRHRGDLYRLKLALLI